MNNSAATPIPLRDLRPALLAAGFALVVLYLVSFEQSALAQSGSTLHELLHDGRHLLGVPCH